MPKGRPTLQHAPYFLRPIASPGGLGIIAPSAGLFLLLKSSTISATIRG
jgi:hypothetical protein